MDTPSKFTEDLQGANLFLLVDLEATCWERRKVRDKNEIIEFGIVLMNTGGSILGQYQSFVRPRINKKLSGFCKKLTGISQTDVDSAIILSDVVVEIRNWAEENFSVDIGITKWASWGNWDVSCIQRDCDRHDIPFPFGEHICLKNHYKALRDIECGLKEAVERENEKWEGHLHRAMDDAYNSHKIAKVFLKEW